MQLVSVYGVVLFIFSSISASPLYDTKATEVDSPLRFSGQTDGTISQIAKHREKRQLRTFWSNYPFQDIGQAVSRGLTESLNRAVSQIYNRIEPDSPIVQMWSNIGTRVASFGPSLIRSVVDSFLQYLGSEARSRINEIFDTSSGSG